MIKKISFLTFIFIGFLYSSAFSQILIEDAKVSLSLTPGQTVMGEVTVDNTSDEEVSIRAYWQDFVYIPPFDGNKKFFPVGTEKNSCGEWVNFVPENFVLKPYGKQKISYTVRFPKEAKEGHYGVLFFENAAPIKDARTGMNIILRAGSLFFLEPAGIQRKLTASNISFSQNQIQGEIENKSQIILIPEGIFYIMNTEGMVVDRGQTEKYYLPPGEGVPFFIDLPKDVPPGDYTLILTFNLGEGSVSVQEIDFKKTQTSLEILQVRD